MANTDDHFIDHDEAFKKLLQTFFKEFIQLFFPRLDEMLDHTHTRFLMQEQLVDIVGKNTRTLDLLLETKYKALDAYILIHLEPQSYRDPEFHERMFIYFSRIFERHRKEHKLIIPIAVFTNDDAKEEKDTLFIGIPEHEVMRFQFLKVELRNNNWRQFIESDNPVAAALLAKMGYNKSEKYQLRVAYLRMLLRLRQRLDDAQLALIMSVADLYFKPDLEQDERILQQIYEQNAEEVDDIMKLMPEWSKKGYEQGIVDGIEKGKQEIARRLLEKGFSTEEIAEMIESPEAEIRKLAKL